MARKDLLKALIEEHKDGAQPERSEAETPKINDALTRNSRGAVGAVSRSLNELKTRSVVEISADLIAMDGAQDRVGDDQVSDEMLLESLREYGQQVPILVRPDPEAAGQYLVVYGRRRLKALRALGEPVKALIRELDDEKALIAQGQENTQRRNLSFIEKARFAKELEDLGYDRKIICDTLAINKSDISRMLKVLEIVPEGWVLAIGAAPSAGRDRWIKLGEMIRALDVSDEVMSPSILAADSDAQFQYIFDALEDRLKSSRPKTVKADEEKASIFGHDQEPIGYMKRNARIVSFEFYAQKNDGFEDWLIAEMPNLHERFKSSKS